MEIVPGNADSVSKDIRKQLHLIDLDFITQNILKPSEKKEVNSFWNSFVQLDSVSKDLECDNIKVGQALE